MATLQVSELWTYPIKSCQGISLQQAHITSTGLQDDRRFMLIDQQNRFVSQRENPALAQIQVQTDEHFLCLQAPNMPPLKVARNDFEGNLQVDIWGEVCHALLLSAKASEWLSDCLRIKVRLVYMPDSTQRKVEPAYNPNEALTSFADAYPFLLISEASLQELNSRINNANPLKMNRFRPNIVVAGGEPYQEDTWQRIAINNVIFEVAKPCARCVVTTINQETLDKTAEPLQTLATYRRVGNKIMFGQNLVHYQKDGILQVGNRIEVLAYK